MTLLSPKPQSRNESNKIEHSYLCSIPANFDLVGSPNSLTSLSSADFVAGGTLDVHTTTKIQRSSTFTSSNQHFTSESDIHSRKKLIRKLTKMQQFFGSYQNSISNLEIEVGDKQQEIEQLGTLLKIKSESEESLKEQKWNLELENQDLQQQMNQLQYSSTKSFAEKTRLECENEMLEQDLENLKMIQHTKDTEIKKIQQDHDHEITLLKQALTLLKQEKDVLNRQLNNNSDKKQTNTSQPKDTNNQDDPKDEHVTAMKKDSKDVESSEVESNTLRVSLENAHIMVRALQKQIQDEVSERCEVNQLLREAQETIETFRNSSLAIQPPQWTSHQNQQGELSSPRNDADSPSKSDDWDQPYIGQSLGDELYQFYNSSSTDKCGQDNAIDDCKTPCNIQDQSDPNEPVTLVCEPQTNVHDTKPEEFGTLIKEPESFIYRPTGNYNGDSIVSENNRANTCHLTEADNLPQMESESSFQNIDKSHLLAIAITMAGNWAWKYKRKLIGKGISSNKHCRFVWIHPYSRTLYWSEMEPGSKGSEYKTKTATIESFLVLNNNQAAIPNILIKTTLRGIQIQFLTMDEHTIWIKSLRFLLTEGGANIDKEASEWLDDIIRPALGKRGLDTKVRRLLDTPNQSVESFTAKQ